MNTFRRINRLPVNFVFGELSTVNDFVKNKAKRHISCNKLFSKHRLNRAKRNRDKNEAGVPYSDTVLKNAAVSCNLSTKLSAFFAQKVQGSCTISVSSVQAYGS